MTFDKPIIKLGEAQILSADSIKSADSVLANPDVMTRMSDAAFLDRFKKVSSDLKTIAPKANDFLYFSAVMMHAAEHALLDDNGQIRKDATGQDINATWEKGANGSWKWVCSDSSIRPYKNSNNDIFPEEELLKAHKQWIGRPLCLDHQSDSVDKIRGVIVDTYYDYPLKRIVALCALDKKNYPDLARKVETGYATCVSMGTAVGKAICSDCGNVARVEADFCDHMRNKSCYGEINTELKPIELSIVVNGADGKATIKHIVAAADSVAKYVSMKEAEISQLADDSVVLKAEQVQDLIDGLEAQLKKANELKSFLSQAAEEPTNKEASEGTNDLTKLAGAIDSIDNKLHKLVEDVTKLSKNNSEETMTNKKAYFQGGGGDNEPTPGKPKYPVEDYTTVRDKQDKQMLGQGVDGMGPVDGMHPGYDSFGETEEARKKRLLRLAEERKERALKRQAALQAAKEKLEKKSYFQGGGGENEPTPGKPKYPVEDYAKTRDNEDKQMTGQAPFPDVGAIDGLHPSPASADEKDELKRKQMLSRAKLRASFVKAANDEGKPDLGESRWSVYAGNDSDGWNLVLTATVDEITNGNADRLYDQIATESFGKNLVQKIRTEGFDRVRALYKSAQGAEPPMPEMPAAAPAPEEGLAEMPDEGGAGDPKDKLMAALTAIDNGAADARAAAEALAEEGGELEDEPGLSAETSELITMHKKLGEALAVSFKEALAEFASHERELKSASAVVNNRTKLNDVDANFIGQVVAEACEDVDLTLEAFAELKEAFCRFAAGSEHLIRRAEAEKSLSKVAQDPTVSPDEALPGDPLAGLEESAPAPAAPKAAPQAPERTPLQDPLYRATMAKLDRDKTMTLHKLTEEEFAALARGAKYKAKHDPDALTHVELMVLRPGRDPGKTYNPADGTVGQQPGAAQMPADDGMAQDHAMAADVTVNQDGTISLKNVPDAELHQFAPKASDEKADIKVAEEETQTKKTAEEVDLTTAEGRAAYREKLAQKGLTFSDMLQKAHPQGGVTTQLDVKPSGDLARVETLPETHDKMMDVATAPPRVKKLAAEIQEMVVAGRIDPSKDLDDLVAMGLDSDAVSYWKQYWGEAKDGGSQFAAELIKEHQKKKAEKEQENFKVKISRAYELAYDLQRRGLIAEGRDALNQQVNEVMSWNDEGFESMKRLAARYEPVAKTAMPNVGMMGVPDVTIPAPEAAPGNLKQAFDEAFAGRKY